MAGGGAAGRAAAAGGPGLLFSCADEPTLAATTETPRRSAVRRRPGASMIALPVNSLVARHSQRATAAIDLCLSLRLCDAGEHGRRLCASANPVLRQISHRNGLLLTCGWRVVGSHHMAMEDACVLAECLRGGRAPTEALDEYVERRRPRVSWVQEESAAAARSFRLSPAVRNAALREGGEEILRRRFMPLVATP
jgi:hypothetical protein